MIQTIPLSLRLMAILLGFAVPSVIFGRAVIAVVLVLALICLLISTQRSNAVQGLKQKALEPFGLMIIVTFLCWMPSVVVSLDPLRSFEAAFRTLLIIGIMTMFWQALRQNRYLPELCLKALIALLAVTLLISVVSLTYAPELISFVKAQGWYLVLEAKAILKPYAAVSALMVPILIWAQYRFSGFWKGLCFSEIIGILFLIWETSNRSAMASLLAIIFMAGLIFALSKKDRGLLIKVMIAVILLFAAALYWNKIRANQFTHGQELYAPTWIVGYTRQMMWKFALNVFEQSPWLGIGINTINLIPGADIPMPNSNLTIISGHPHNWIIETLTETGVIGFIPLFAVSIYMIVRGFFKALHYPGSGALPALLVITGYWSSSLFNYSFWSVWWQVSFMLLTLICLSFPAKDDHLRA